MLSLFLSVLWAILLLPWGLVVFGRLIGKEIGRYQPLPGEDTFWRPFTRWIAGVSSSLPIILFSVLSLPEKTGRQLSPFIWMAIVVVGGSAAAYGVFACFTRGRGPERFTGAAACLLAVALLALIVFAGMAAA